MNPDAPTPDDETPGDEPVFKPHPLYDRMGSFQIAIQHVDAQTTAHPGPVLVNACLDFVGGQRVVYRRLMPYDEFDLQDEAELARAACYSQLTDSIGRNTVSADPHGDVQRTTNVRRRF